MVYSKMRINFDLVGSILRRRGQQSKEKWLWKIYGYFELSFQQCVCTHAT